MTSTGRMAYYRPELMGKYELQYKLENDRLVYANNESLMYMYSAKRNDDSDGTWMVCNVLSKCYNNEFMLIKNFKKLPL